MLYQDVIRAFDALIGEIEGAGEAQKKTGWMPQAWHRRLTWVRWLREVRSYVEDKETMALARIVEINGLKEALAARAFVVCTCRHDSGVSSDCAVHGAMHLCGICEENIATHEIEGDGYTGPICDDCHPRAIQAQTSAAECVTHDDQSTATQEGVTLPVGEKPAPVIQSVACPWCLKRGIPCTHPFL